VGDNPLFSIHEFRQQKQHGFHAVQRNRFFYVVLRRRNHHIHRPQQCGRNLRDFDDGKQPHRRHTRPALVPVSLRDSLGSHNRSLHDYREKSR